MIFFEHPVYLLYTYLALANLALFITMGADKSFARRGERRVPEATLFLLALIGGGLGGILGMLCFRHKTRHRSFVIGFPLILAAHIALAAYIMIHL